MPYIGQFRQCPSGTVSYRITEGETLYTIARKFNTTINAIMTANPGLNSQNLYGGLEICVPRPQVQPIPQPQMHTCPPGSIPYRIIEGDTLFSIAQKFNTTIDAIMAVNPGLNPQNLYGGLQICVPQPYIQPAPQPPALTCPIGTSPYEIKSGDTFASIAKRFNTTVAALTEANPGVNPNRLFVGQTICVAQNQPKYPPCPTLNYYVIREGDTLFSIAAAFNTTVQALLNSNPGLKPTNLYGGLVICIPLAPSPLSITISKANRLLTLYRQGRFVKSYPVAVGKPSTPSPTGTFTIINKQVDPGGPFGTRWMGLSIPHYGIHGTNNPASIGTEASNGCIRMHNNDVEELFSQVGVGTVVRIF